MALVELLPLDAGTRQWPVWSTVARILVADPSRADAAERLVRAELDAVDLACSRFRADSELSMLPRDRNGRVDTRVSPLLRDLVATALTAADRSDGDVDPTLGDELAALGYVSDYAELEVTGSPVRVRLTRRIRPGLEGVRLNGSRLRIASGIHLDLGATAKARAADRAARTVHDRLDVGVLVSLGGDISVAGPAPSGGWQVRVQDGPDEPATVVALHHGGLATSSTRSRRWRHGTRLVHHVLDPRTGEPAETVWRTVSVAAESCVAANTASTAAIVRGHSAPRQLNQPARFVRQDGTVLTLNGWPPHNSPSAASDQGIPRGLDSLIARNSLIAGGVWR